MPWSFLRFWRAAAPQETPPPRRRSAAAAETGDAAIEQARLRARRRLIGALVLLAIGVIAFPLVFETEPRPMGGEAAPEFLRRDAGVVGQAPAAASEPGSPQASTDAVAAPPAASPSASASAPPAVAEPVEEFLPPTVSPSPPTPAAEPAAAPPASTPPPASPASAPAAPAATTSPPAAPATAASPPAARDSGERARALLEGRTPPRTASTSSATTVAPAPAPAPTAPAGGPGAAPRFVVQVGAYSEAGALRAARSNVERLGLSTYTQVIQTPAGERTRVRVGPFSDRAEAERAAARLRAAGLPAAILTL